VLRVPLQLLFGALRLGLCFILWRPIPVTLAAPARVVALVLGTPLYFAGIAREEEALAMEFGREWEAYAERVLAWIPRLCRKARLKHRSLDGKERNGR